jgi:hypothetical protein
MAFNAGSLVIGDQAQLAADNAALDALKGGRTAQFLAALASTSPTFVYTATADGTTVLHWCALKGDIEAMTTVLALGAEVRLEPL